MPIENYFLLILAFFSNFCGVIIEEVITMTWEIPVVVGFVFYLIVFVGKKWYKNFWGWVGVAFLAVMSYLWWIQTYGN